MADKGTRSSFEDKMAQLDGIVKAVREKDTSLEKSLDLLDEAIAVGLEAVELVDTSELSPGETANQLLVDETDADAAKTPDADGADGNCQ